MHPILPGLYLASWQQVQAASLTDDTLAEDTEWFIVNCTKNLPMAIQDPTRTLRIAVDDDLSPAALNGMLEALPGTLHIMHDVLHRGGTKVVVHCQAGQQRSPAVIAAYLMRYCNMSLTESVLFIKDRKADAFFWNANFLPTLEAFGAQLRDACPMCQELKNNTDKEIIQIKI